MFKRPLTRAVLGAACAAATLGAPTPGGAQTEARWIRLDHPLEPSARAAAGGHAYDSRRHRWIVFGGTPGHRNDVWALDLLTERWEEIFAADRPPSARTRASLVYDSAHDRLIVFGGTDDAGPSNEVWELSLDGSPAWTLLAPAGNPPSPRSGHVAAYDPAGSRMIVFGGDGGAGPLGDTFELSLGKAPEWRELTFAGPTPLGRDLAAAAFDPSGRRLILFGGWIGDLHGDTWALSLEGEPKWSAWVTAESPSPRFESAMAWDAANRRMLLYGGWDEKPLGDVWALDLGGDPAWRLVSHSAEPGTLAGHSLGYDPARGRVLAFGGHTLVPIAGGELTVHASRVWELDPGATRWSERSVRLGQIRNHRTVIDPVAGRLMVVGGEQIGTGAHDLFAMALDTGRWEKLHPGTRPEPRTSPGLVWDAARDRMLMFGGYDSDFRNDLWEYRARPAPEWSPLATHGPVPEPRFAAGVALDAARDRLIVYGGYRIDPAGAPVILGDVWALPLSGPAAMTWQPLDPPGDDPGPRWGHALVMDPPGDRALMIGGGRSIHEASADLFALELGGPTPAWHRVTGPPPFPPRMLHAAVADPARNRVVVFGGWDPAFGYRGDTWIGALGGEEWTAAATTGPAPAPRGSMGAALDPATGRVLITAGGATAAIFSDTWALEVEPAPVAVGGEPADGSSGTLMAAPNPARADRLTLAFRLATGGPARLALHDLAGRVVASRDLGTLEPGDHRLAWTVRPLPPGLYLARLDTGRGALTTRVILLR